MDKDAKTTKIGKIILWVIIIFGGLYFVVAFVATFLVFGSADTEKTRIVNDTESTIVIRTVIDKRHKGVTFDCPLDTCNFVIEAGESQTISLSEASIAYVEMQDSDNATHYFCTPFSLESFQEQTSESTFALFADIFKGDFFTQEYSWSSYTEVVPESDDPELIHAACVAQQVTDFL